MIKKLSPCRVILIAAALLLLAGVCYMLWPHSFAALQPECDSITIIRTDNAEDLSYTTTKETYSADSPAFAQIMDILSRYTYHRSFPDAGRSTLDGRQSRRFLA